MNRSSRRFLFWAPRVLTILFAAFMSVFALDVFDGRHGPWQTLLALAIHLIPTFAVLAILLVSWRWEWVGGALYALLGALYIAVAWGRFDWASYAAISGPLFLNGALFWAGWIFRRQIRPAHVPPAPVACL